MHLDRQVTHFSSVGGVTLTGTSHTALHRCLRDGKCGLIMCPKENSAITASTIVGKVGQKAKEGKVSDRSTASNSWSPLSLPSKRWTPI